MKRLLALTILLLLVPVFALAGGLEDQISKTYIDPNIHGYPTANLPSDAKKGQLAYDTTTDELKTYTGSAWVAATGGGAPTDATFITKTANGSLSAEQALGSLGTGCLGSTTTSGDVASRTITGTANEITVTNGNCSGNPTLSLPSALDLGGKTVEIPNSTTLPATCNVGEMYMDTDATSGQRFYLCQSANTWALQGDGTGGLTTHNLLSSTHSDTVAASPVLGDTICGNVSSLWTVCAGSTSATKKFFTQTGTGSASALPGWNVLVAGDLPATAVLTDTSNSWSDGVKQTFNPNNTNAGVNVGSNATDPASPANGDIWYDSGNNTLDARINGATVNLGAGGGTDTFTLAFQSGGNSTNTNPIANTSYYLYNDGGITTGDLQGFIVPQTGTLVAVYWKIFVQNTLGTAAQTVTHKLLKGTIAGGTLSTGCTTDYSASVNSCSETGLSTAYTAGDYIQFKITTPNPWTTPATQVRFAVSMKFTNP